MSIVTTATVENVNSITDHITEYILKPEKYIPYAAGQFLQLSLETDNSKDHWPDSRTFSIASYQPEKQTLRLIIKQAGKYTEKILQHLHQGSTCLVKYAFGDFTLPPNDAEGELICIASGTGITPFLAFIDALEQKHQLHRMKLLYSVKHSTDILEKERLQQTIHPEKLVLFTTREKNTATLHRRIELDDIIDYKTDFKRKHYYICGSNDFIKHYKRLLQMAGVPHIYADDWD